MSWKISTANFGDSKLQISGWRPSTQTPRAGCGAVATAAAKAWPLWPSNGVTEDGTPASFATSMGVLKARWMGSMVSAGESRLVTTASLAAAAGAGLGVVLGREALAHLVAVVAVGDRRGHVEHVAVALDAAGVVDAVEHVEVAVGVAVAHQRLEALQILAQEGVELAVVLGEEQHGLEIHLHGGQQRGAVGQRLVQRLLVRADDARVLVAHEAENAQPLAAHLVTPRQLDDVGIDGGPRIAGDDPLAQPLGVQGRGEPVGIAPLGRHRLAEVDELMRRLGVIPVAQRVVELVVRRRGQFTCLPGGRRVVDSLEGVQAHAFLLPAVAAGPILSVD